MVTVVAFNDPFRQMVLEGNSAIGASEIIATVGTDQKGVKSPFVEKKQGLFFAGQCCGNTICAPV